MKIKLSEIFYILKINFYQHNFIKSKIFAYVCPLTLYVCKVLTGAVLTGAGQVRTNFKYKLIQVNSDTPYKYM